MLSDQAKAEIQATIGKYPVRKSAVLPSLHIAQHEAGYLRPDDMEEIAAILGMSASDVYAVASFYTMLRMEPVGTYLIEVCTCLMCALRGSDRIVHHISDRLGVAEGETTADGVFTHRPTVECLASCGTGPMMQINHQFYENLTPGRVDVILDELRVQAANGQKHQE
jgi:NADH-quinone oxidoreductase E subunit